MAITQRTIAINDFGLRQLERTSAKGKVSSRFAVSIDATPLLHVFDPVELGRGAGEAIAEHLRARVRTISENASPSTLATRANAARAFEAGQAGARKRYSGGRIGPMAPNQSSKLFNDSGRLADGISARYGKSGEWIVNFPANRMSPRTFADGVAEIDAMYRRLIELVPEFGDAKALLRVPSVRAAIIDGAKSMTQKLSQARLRVITQALTFFR